MPLKERFDIATVAGNAAHPSVLEQAWMWNNTDMVIAVTDSDETNMLACMIINDFYSRPKTLHGAGHRLSEKSKVVLARMAFQSILLSARNNRHGVLS